MKYSQTARSLSVVFHGLIVAAFGALGLYFGFFVVPEFFNPVSKGLFTQNLFAGSYLLYLELAVIGLTLFLVSAYGLVKACLSIVKNSDEELVKSFSAFIADGWAVSIFFLLQGALLFDLTTHTDTSSSPAFIVVAGLLLAVVFLIATNIPMVKLFDGKDSSILATRLAWAAGTSMLVLGFLNLFALPGLYAATDLASDNDFALQLWLMVLAGLISGGLLVYLGFHFKKHGIKGNPLVSCLSIGFSGMAIAVAMIVTGVCELIGLGADNGHGFYTLLTINNVPVGYGYPVMLVILGALLGGGTIAFIIYSVTPKTHKAEA